MEIKHRIQFGCDTDELADKVLSGEKTATSSLYDYSLMNQEEIKVNEYASILDSQGKEKCIVKIERIEIVDFQDITEEFAVNEGDGCLDNWIKIHTEYYSSLLEKIDKKLTGRTISYCIRYCYSCHNLTIFSLYTQRYKIVSKKIDGFLL